MLFLFLFTVTLFPEDGTVPGGMAEIPGTVYQMGTDKSELQKLAELGKNVPEMNRSTAEGWFGDEVPVHPVTIQAFYMDIHEVSNARFREFVNATGYKAQGSWEKYAERGREDHPVVNVTWNDAAAYAEWAGKRLPTEAEWEYAASGGAENWWFPWGNEPDPSKANYRFKGESFLAGLWRILGLRKMGTKPVGTYPPNGFGLYDMAGNAAEWTADYYRPYPGALKKDFDDTKKVVRGGSWGTPNAVFLRITYRSGFNPSSFSRTRGFRCVKSKD